MYKSIVSLAIGATCLSLAGLADAQQSGYSASTHSAVIEVEASIAVTLAFDTPFSELSSGNPEIADIATLSGTQVYLLGKSIGETTVTVLREGNAEMGVTDYRIVVYRDIAPLQTFLAGSANGVELTRDGIFVTAKGCVDGPRAAAAAERVTGELDSWGYVTLADIATC